MARRGLYRATPERAGERASVDPMIGAVNEPEAALKSPGAARVGCLEDSYDRRTLFEAVLFDFFGILTLPVMKDVLIRASEPVAEALGVPTNQVISVPAETFSARCQGQWGSFSETMARPGVELGVEFSAPWFPGAPRSAW